MKRLAWFSLSLTLAIPLAQAAEAPVWPAGVIDKNDPRLLAFYDAQCSRYADQNGLTGEGREAFFSQCRENIALVFPAGYAEGGGGGE